MIRRDVEPGALADLALSPPRAALAATIDDEIHLVPVASSVEDPTDPGFSPRVVQVPQTTPDLAGRNVVLIADDGPQWFRLRSLTVRGTAVAIGDGSYRLSPRRVVAWDYGSLRFVPAQPETAEPQEPVLGDSDDRDNNALRSSTLEAALSGSRVMILATRSAKGTPFAVPLWLVAHRGQIYATTAASSWTVRNVVGSPQVAILLGGEKRRDTRRVLVRGRAVAVAGTPPVAVLARIAWRYYLDPKFAVDELSHVQLWGRRMQYYAQSQAAHIVIAPQSTSEFGADAEDHWHPARDQRP